MICEIEVHDATEQPLPGEWVIGYNTTYRGGWQFVRMCVGGKGGRFWANQHGSIATAKITHWFRPPVLS